MKSIIQSEKECYLCRRMFNVSNTTWLENHHIIFGTANRRKSDKYGLTVYLCKMHHTLSEYSVHMNRQTDVMLKRIAQEAFEKNHTREEFMREFGKNYL